MSGPPDLLLHVFARAPQPGRAKTRLIPAVGPVVAARMYAAFVDDVCRLSRGVAQRRVLSIDGDPNDPLLRTLAEREAMGVQPQVGNDLGARMQAAIANGLAAGHSRVAIIGSDSPCLPSDQLARTLALLDYAQIVLGPAEDGGYWLVGARVVEPKMFRNIAWGTPSVFAETRARLVAARRSFAIGEHGWDVDVPSDLDRLQKALRENRDRAPATRAVLAQIHGNV